MSQFHTKMAMYQASCENNNAQLQYLDLRKWICNSHTRIVSSKMHTYSNLLQAQSHKQSQTYGGMSSVHISK